VASLAEGGCVMADRWDGGDESRIAALTAENEGLQKYILRLRGVADDAYRSIRAGRPAEAEEYLRALNVWHLP
jgi:hypothetical protein